MNYPSERAPILDELEDRYGDLQDEFPDIERSSRYRFRIESPFSRMKHRVKPAQRTGKGPSPVRKRSTAHLYEILPSDGVAIREGLAISTGEGHGAERSLDQIMDVLHNIGEIAVQADKSAIC